jgi:hypothetical protein
MCHGHACGVFHFLIANVENSAGNGKQRETALTLQKTKQIERLPTAVEMRTMNAEAASTLRCGEEVHFLGCKRRRTLDSCKADLNAGNDSNWSCVRDLGGTDA